VSDSTILRLDRLPSLGPLYARAALMPKSRPRDVEALPNLRVEVAGVRSDAALLARYRHVCGFTDASSMPITWPQTLAAALQIVVLVHPTFPLPAMGVVHLSQSIELLEELGSDALLDLSCAVGAWERTARGLEFELLTEAHHAGRVVWRGTTRILGRLKAREPSVRPAALGAEAASIDQTPPARSVCWWVPEDLGRRYGAVSGDYNPIHLWAATARPFGFKRAIAQGMWLLARCAAELEDDVGPGPRTLSVDFRRPVSLPSKVAFDARRRGPRTLDFALLSRDPGKPHLAGRYAGR
jgi:acyl dehydratase